MTKKGFKTGKFIKALCGKCIDYITKERCGADNNYSLKN